MIYTPFSQQVNNPGRDPHFLLCFASFKILQDLNFFGLSHRIPRKIKNAVYGCKYLIVPEIFTNKYCVTYANEMTDDIIDSTKYNIKYIQRYLSQFETKTIETWQANRSTCNTPTALTIMFPWQPTLFQYPPTSLQHLSAFELNKH